MSVIQNILTHSMKTYVFPWSNESSDNIKFFILLLSKEECVSVGPKIWKIIPRGVEEISRNKDVFHQHHHSFDKKPEIDANRSQKSVSVESLQGVQDKMESQDQGVTIVNLSECHKVLSVSEPPVLRVV